MITGIQGYKITEIQGYRITGIQGYRIKGIQLYDTYVVFEDAFFLGNPGGIFN